MKSLIDLIKKHIALIAWIGTAITAIATTAYNVGIAKGGNAEVLTNLDGRVTTVEKWIDNHSREDKTNAVETAKILSQLQTDVAALKLQSQEQSRKLDEIRDRLH